MEKTVDLFAVPPVAPKSTYDIIMETLMNAQGALTHRRLMRLTKLSRTSLSAAISELHRSGHVARYGTNVKRFEYGIGDKEYIYSWEPGYTTLSAQGIGVRKREDNPNVPRVHRVHKRASATGFIKGFHPVKIHERVEYFSKDELQDIYEQIKPWVG